MKQELPPEFSRWVLWFSVGMVVVCLVLEVAIRRRGAERVRKMEAVWQESQLEEEKRRQEMFGNASGKRDGTRPAATRISFEPLFTRERQADGTTVPAVPE